MMESRQPRPPRAPSEGGPQVIDVVRVRPARKVDVPILASMNDELVKAEWGPATLSIGQLTARMATFLERGYEAHIVESGDDMVGYVLFRRDVDHVFVRHFYIAPGQRRAGVGRRVFEWMSEKVWAGERVILQVRGGHEQALRFWEALGFQERFVALEWSPEADGGQVR
jgi:ribosomal protein S18 acetylase RimI-like enzyme